MTKYIKLVIGVSGLIILSGGIFYFVKQPSYSIKTEGILYVVNKASKNITVFDLYEGKKVKDISVQQEPHEATALANSNKVVITNYGSPKEEGKSISIINTDNNALEQTIDLGEKSIKPHGIISLNDSNKVAVVTDIGNNLSIVNIKTGLIERQISTKQDFSHLAVQHPIKPLVYISNINSGSVSVVDIELDKVVRIIPIGEHAEGIDITADGSEIWVTNIKENLITVIDTDTYEIENKIKTGREPLRLKFSTDGNYCLVSNSSDGTVSVFSTITKELVSTITIPGKKNILEKVIFKTPRPVGILMHPNGLYAFVSNLSAGRVEVIEMNNFTIISSIDVGDMPDGLAFIN